MLDQLNYIFKTSRLLNYSYFILILYVTNLFTEKSEKQEELSWKKLDVSSVKGYEKIIILMQNWQALFQTKRSINGAAVIVKKIISEIKKCPENELVKVFSLYNLLVDIINGCRSTKKFNEAVGLALSQLIILQKCTLEPSILLRKLEQLGICFVCLAYTFCENNNVEEFVHLHLHIETVLDEMYCVDVDKHLDKEEESSTSLFVLKTDTICKVLREYGILCYRAKNFEKTIVIFSQKVALQKLVYGNSIKELIECYYFLKLSYTHCSMPNQAAVMYKNATNTFESVKNWNNLEEEENYRKELSGVSKNLET